MGPHATAGTLLQPPRGQCASGGIGRRARFRSVYSKGCGGSTPPSRTTQSPGQDSLTGASLCLGYLPALRHQLLFESNHSTRRHEGPPLPPLPPFGAVATNVIVKAGPPTRGLRLKVPDPTMVEIVVVLCANVPVAGVTIPDAPEIVAEFTKHPKLLFLTTENISPTTPVTVTACVPVCVQASQLVAMVSAEGDAVA